jgi:DeoR/GlpR family transcriptional regulator of sugar metabolism
MGTFGVFAEDMLRHVSIDKLFITCRAIHPRSGVSNALQAEFTVSSDRAMVAAARELIVLADHTKLGQVFLIETVPIGKVDVLVTDSLASDDVLEEFRGGDTRVIVAPVGGAAPPSAA